MDENKPKGIELLQAIVKGTKIISATDDKHTTELIEDYAILDIEHLIFELDYLKEPVVLLGRWQTIKAYAKEKQVSTQYVSKLIRQGKLSFKEYPELNNLKLVKPKN